MGIDGQDSPSRSLMSIDRRHHTCFLLNTCILFAHHAALFISRPAVQPKATQAASRQHEPGHLQHEGNNILQALRICEIIVKFIQKDFFSHHALSWSVQSTKAGMPAKLMSGINPSLHIRVKWGTAGASLDFSAKKKLIACPFAVYQPFLLANPNPIHRHTTIAMAALAGQDAAQMPFIRNLASSGMSSQSLTAESTTTTSIATWEKSD